MSGYRVLEGVDGAYRGKQLVARYDPSCRASILDWNLSRQVAFGSATAIECHFGGPDCGGTPAGDGVVETWKAGAIEAYVDEASARAARDERCKANR